LDELAGYQQLNCIHHSRCSQVFRGVKEGDNCSVILKVVDKNSAKPEYLDQLRNEYKILTSIPSIKGVPEVIEFIDQASCLVLVIADFGGVSLEQLLQQSKYSAKQVVEVLTQCVTILDSLHQQHIIHKDLKPSNILWNDHTKTVQIIDYGLSVAFNQKLDQFYQPTSLEGSVYYMSPELTGRVNRQVDYRSDYYALGVTAYQLLSQQLPFDSKAGTEDLLYILLVTEVTPLHLLDSSIPISLSNIIMHLMAKDAEDRYQTALGLTYDLSCCLSEVDLILGQQDICKHFQLPKHVYGRDNELNTLTQALSKVVAGGQERVLVAGYSGIGKTALIHELYRYVAKEQGCLLEGKFDQMQRNKPLYAFIQAFDDFFGSLLTESEPIVASWRQKLAEGLADNTGVLTQLIPNLEYLLGAQPEPLYLGGDEGVNRLLTSFKSLILIFATPNQPLVLFIDDLQWVDLASQRLIEELFFNNTIPHTLLIGAYRDNAITAGHSLFDLVNSEQYSVEHLYLKNLTISALTQLIEDGFQHRLKDSEKLAEHIYSKSAGNPFFALQIITKLIDDKFIYMESDNYWHYDSLQLGKQSVADNVVELMLEKIQTFPADAITLLSSAAAIGHEFTLGNLGIITQKSGDQVKQILLPVLQSGILVAAENDIYFAHDGIQEAAYQINDLAKRQDLHYRIGSILYTYYKEDINTLKKNVFDICFHLNHGQRFIDQHEEVVSLIEFNLQAAQQAKQSAAYTVALDYILNAITLFDNKISKPLVELSFSVFREAAECAYLCGEFNRAEQYLNRASDFVGNKYQQCQLINLRIVQKVSTGDYVQSMEWGYKGLSLYGVELPDAKNEVAVNQYFEDKQRAFLDDWIGSDKTIADLYDLPVNKDSEVGLLMELLGSLYASALMSFPDYLKVITIALVDLSIKYGNTPTSPIAYAWHGSVIAAISHDYDDAYAFGELAIRLNEQKIHNPTIACKIYNMVGNFIAYFKDPLRKTLPLLRRAYDFGMTSGDKLYGGYSIINELRNTLSTGMPLNSWLKLDDEIKLKLEQCDADVMVEVRESFRAYVLQMTGQSKSAEVMDNNGFCEQEYREKYAEVPLFGSLLDSWKIQSAYHLGHFEQALELSYFSITPIDSFVLGTEMRFFAALTLAHYLILEPDHADSERRNRYFYQYQNHLEIVAESCPENFLHLYLILKGEAARISNNTLQAAGYFNKAIRSAKENEFVHYEALANELVGKLYLQEDIYESGHSHIEMSYKLFDRWGAQAKLNQLESTYPKVNLLKMLMMDHSSTTSGFIGKQEITDRIDLKSVVDASLALSTEMDINRLIDSLMKVALESSAAQRGVLLLNDEGQWLVSAERDSDTNETISNAMSLGDPTGKLALSVLNYVVRSGNNVLLDDALTHKVFSNDDYIKRNQVKSIICLPLVHQGKTVAILYLENKLWKNAFDLEKNSRLELLSAQMAAAIENSSNYQRLSESEYEKRALLKGLPIGVVVHDATTKITYANPRAYQMLRSRYKDITGFKVESLEGTMFNETEEVIDISEHPVSRVLQTEKPLNNVIYGYQLPRENKPRWFMTSAFPQFKQQKIKRIVTCFIDITERRESEAKIKHLAYHDVLTDLPNRSYLEIALAEIISEPVNVETCSAILLLDMDHFKVINDSLGHWVGDEMLKQVASRLRLNIAKEHLVARLGGDEFVVMISNLSGSESNMLEHINAVAACIQHSFMQPFSVEGRQLSSAASIGVAIAPKDGQSIDELLRHADTALYQSKKDGRNTISYFQSEQETELQRRLEIENELRIGIDANQLRLLYQPKVDVQTGRIVAAEALVRWQHPEEGTISPIEFIPVAEESGLIIALGEWVLNEACRQVNAWTEKTSFNCFQRISVNVSPFQFKHPGFQNIVVRALNETGLKPEQLDLEITEGLLLQHTELMIEQLNLFKEMGLTFSIDDFGTGYSSLTYLKRLPVDVLKIDQSFVRDMDSDEDDRAIVQTILSMAKNLRLKTVAEGVETAEQLEILKDMGAMEYQGYYFSKPVSAEEFEALMLKQAAD